MIEYHKNHIQGSEATLHLINKDRKIPCFKLEVVESEVTFTNSYDSYFIHSSLRFGKKSELYSFIDSEVENVTLHQLEILDEHVEISCII